MKRLFLCLANSKKYSGRCIAGIELKIDDDGGLRVVQENGKPQWIRPVSESTHGAISTHLINHIKIRDVIEIEATEEHFSGYQSENVLFDASSILVKKRINLKKQDLDRLITQQPNLFGNRGKAVSEDRIEEVSHSLILIKAKNPTVYTRKEFGKDQLRMKFIYSQTEYDLSITDLDFLEDYAKSRIILAIESEIYLTISLGLPHEGWHYKLVAGVIHS